eukprot:1860098-Alexandrium_andersonii.AAC.1
MQSGESIPTLGNEVHHSCVRCSRGCPARPQGQSGLCGLGQVRAEIHRHISPLAHALRVQPCCVATALLVRQLGSMLSPLLGQ